MYEAPSEWLVPGNIERLFHTLFIFPRIPRFLQLLRSVFAPWDFMDIFWRSLKSIYKSENIVLKRSGYLFILCYVFGSLGMFMFKDDEFLHAKAEFLHLNEGDDDLLGALERYNTLMSAMLACLQIMTFDGWCSRIAGPILNVYLDQDG